MIADLDNDGKAEVIFTTWTQKQSGVTGDLFVLDYNGNLLSKVALPPPFGSANWNGGLASPTIDRLDTSGNLSVIVNTASSGIVAYTIPGTKNARILWGTGRANYRRDGNVFNPDAAIRPGSFGNIVTNGAERKMIRCRFGGMMKTVAAPFDVSRGFRAEVIDAAGKKVPSRVAGNCVEVMSGRAGLYLVKIEQIDGKEFKVLKVLSEANGRLP